MHINVSVAAGGTRFTMHDDALLILHFWHEATNIVRASVAHPATGTTAYLQGTDELAGLSRALDLELQP